MIDWLKRAKKADTYLAERKRYESRCKQYMVESSDLRYGRQRDENGQRLGYPMVFRAMYKRNGFWSILSTHKKLGPAKKALEYFAEHGRPMPKQTKAAKAKRRQKAKRKARRDAKA